MTAGRQPVSNNKEWATPPKYAELVHSIFGTIHLDPCSNSLSIIKADIRYTLPETDGLVASWDYPNIYVNPPYGRDSVRKTNIGNWLKRCADAHIRYNSWVIALVPVATNTKAWKNYIFGVARDICFLSDTRLRFIGGNTKGAPMACCLVHWGDSEKSDRFRFLSSPYGAVLNMESLIKKKTPEHRTLLTV